jgi:hypothetical protein
MELIGGPARACSSRISLAFQVLSLQSTTASGIWRRFGGIKKLCSPDSSIRYLIIHKAKILRKIHSQQLLQFKSICC